MFYKSSLTSKCIFSKLCKKNVIFFDPRFLKGFYEKMFTSKMGISFYKPVSEQSTYCTTSRLQDSH